MKNADNWITDIEHISESLSKETEDAETDWIIRRICQFYRR